MNNHDKMTDEIWFSLSDKEKGQWVKAHEAQMPGCKYCVGWNVDLNEDNILRLTQTHPEVMYHRKVAEVTACYGVTALHKLAFYFDAALSHPLVDKVLDVFGETPVHHAARVRESILARDDVATLKNGAGETPLHFLAMWSCKVVDHPQVSYVTNNHGQTPLHLLAQWSAVALRHPDVSLVKNSHGQTPMEYFNNSIHGGRLMSVEGKVAAVSAVPVFVARREIGKPYYGLVHEWANEWFGESLESLPGTEADRDAQIQAIQGKPMIYGVEDAKEKRMILECVATRLHKAMVAAHE